jgi:hypothetical protein
MNAGFVDTKGTYAIIQTRVDLKEKQALIQFWKADYTERISYKKRPIMYVTLTQFSIHIDKTKNNSICSQNWSVFLMSHTMDNTGITP